MALEVVLNKPGVYRILLEESMEGTYVNVFDSPDARGPCRDQLQDNVDMAKCACRQDYGVKDADWREAPDERWH